jgi:hypothetical protein
VSSLTLHVASVKRTQPRRSLNCLGCPPGQLLVRALASWHQPGSASRANEELGPGLLLPSLFEGRRQKIGGCLEASLSGCKSRHFSVGRVTLQAPPLLASCWRSAGAAASATKGKHEESTPSSLAAPATHYFSIASPTFAAPHIDKSRGLPPQFHITRSPTFLAPVSQGPHENFLSFFQRSPSPGTICEPCLA